MKKNTNILYIVSLLVSFTAVSLLLVLGASNLIAFFKSGSKQLTVLNTPQTLQFHSRTSWNLENSEGRLMEEPTMEKITEDYQAALKVLDNSYRKGIQPEFNDYLTSKARISATSSVISTRNSGLISKSKPLDHHIALDFYAADGSQVVFRDNRLSVQQLIDQEGNILAQSYDSSQYRVMMLLEDNFWRVRHIKRSDEVQLHNKTILKDTLNDFVKVKANQFMLGEKRFTPKGINYYPSDHPWELFWREFNLDQVENDFNIIKELGLNTVRIFIPYGEFGSENVSPEQIEKLRKLLDLSETHQIKIIVTLFDFFLDYDLDHWTRADRHLESVLTTFNEHPAVFAWDIKNEADLDFDSRGRKEVLSWLDFILRRARNYDPNHLLTIGWSAIEQYNLLWDQVDFSSIHFYKQPSLLADWLASEEVQNIKKPIFLGEFGRHTYKSWWYPIGYTQKDQNNYLKEILEVIDANELPYAIWTLYDFTDVPDHIAGSYPWRRYPQERYGLISKNQKPKKAFKTLKEFNTK